MSEVRKVWSTSPVGVFLCVDAIALQHVADGIGSAGQKVPAVRIGAEVFRVLLQHLRRVALGIDGDRDEDDVLAEAVSERYPEPAPSCR